MSPGSAHGLLQTQEVIHWISQRRFLPARPHRKVRERLWEESGTQQRPEGHAPQ